MCDLDPRCGAVNCAGKHEFGSIFDGKGCMWWRVGACVDDYETHVKPRDNANKGYLCYKGKWKPLTIVKIPLTVECSIAFFIFDENYSR